MATKPKKKRGEFPIIGSDYERVNDLFTINNNYEVVRMVAIGKEKRKVENQSY